MKSIWKELRGTLRTTRNWLISSKLGLSPRSCHMPRRLTKMPVELLKAQANAEARSFRPKEVLQHIVHSSNKKMKHHSNFLKSSNKQKTNYRVLARLILTILLSPNKTAPSVKPLRLSQTKKALSIPPKLCRVMKAVTESQRLSIYFKPQRWSSIYLQLSMRLREKSQTISNPQ